MMNNTGKTIFIWGVAVLLGWLGPYFFPMQLSLPFNAMIYWSALMLVALVATHFLMPNAWQNKTVQLWAVIVVLGMIENWIVSLDMGLSIAYGMLSFNHLWLLLAAIGFYLTTKTWKVPKSVPIYMGAAVLNAVLFVLLTLANPLMVDFPFAMVLFMNMWLLFGVIQGVPMIIDGFTNYNTPKKA